MHHHWENIYKTKDPTKVSWFQTVPTPSLDLISEATKETVRVIDVGGGTSSLWLHLLEAGYSHISVLDISDSALELARSQQSTKAKDIEWIVDDVLQHDFPKSYYNIWHDRAVFHFLNSDAEKQIYVSQAAKAVQQGGMLIIGTFSMHGPQQCSNLPVQRYDLRSLSSVFESKGYFTTKSSLIHQHHTPSGTTQEFIFVVFERTSKPCCSTVVA